MNPCAAMRLYAFLDIEYPPVAWAVMRGTLVSANRVPCAGAGFISFMMAGMVYSQHGTRFSNEQVIELRRSLTYPQKVSRLRGMYFFESRELAARAIGDTNWPSYFTSCNLVELRLDVCDSITRVDSDWITNAPRDPETGLLDLQKIDWIESYWAGEPRSNKPLWEIIVNGVAVVTDTSVRERAYDVVHDAFPKCWVVAEMARLAGEAGSDGGLVAPFLLKEDGDAYMLAYWLRDADYHDPIAIQGIQGHPDFSRLHHGASQSDFICLPDFGPFGGRFTIGQWQPLAI